MSMRTLSLKTARWEFFEPRTDRWLVATVPGCVHLDLHRHKLIPDPFWGNNERTLQWIEREKWRYRCGFTLDPAWLAENEIVELVADGLDTLATITLNSHEIAQTDNMFVGYRWSVDEFLQAGENELRIDFAPTPDYIARHRRPNDFREWNDFVGGCSQLRKEQCQFGWDWGPRLVSAGIWRDIHLEAWRGGRIACVHVHQHHHVDGDVLLDAELTCSFAPSNLNPFTLETGMILGRLRLHGALIAEAQVAIGNRLVLHVPNPQLWWPNGHGAQPLYELEVALLDASIDAVLDTWQRRIGLRTILLDRSPDEFGEKFQFVVNGRPIFAKGANWIPAHAFAPAADERTRLNDLLTSAVAAYMNALRVWGGGIYESDTFYDLCDEKGLLVWQDFMFACALYPDREEFLHSVKAEAAYQVKRLAHHACLALWCGNNEIEQMPQEIAATPERTMAYEKIFYKLLPAAVACHDGTTHYWPSSPHNPAGWRAGVNSERGGDAHFWDVWHARQPVQAYEATRFRFVSEFGMQSYSSPEVAATFCPPKEWNVFGLAMESHQKNAAGNLIIFDYLSRLYRLPNGYPKLAYLSQLNQAHCMKVAVEHFRRSMPRTMGALYWQLNDCWPVFSWSSLEFGGKWKALHYAARRFFAPALVSVQALGDERSRAGQTFVSTTPNLHLYTVYDGTGTTDGELRWELCHLHDGRILKCGAHAVALRSRESVCWERLDLLDPMRIHGAAHLYLHVSLAVGGEMVSEDTLFLTAPRFLSLPRAKIEIVTIEQTDPLEYQLTFRSPVFQHRVMFDFDPPLPHRSSDNFFDLQPNRPYSVTLRLLGEALNPELLRARLRTLSLGDSY